MKTLRTITAVTLITVMMLAALSSLSPVAHAEESRWQFKTSLVVLDTDSPYSIDNPSGGQVHAGGDAALGAAIALEYRISDLIGLELATAYAKTPDIDDNTSSDGYELGEGPSFMPIIIGANFHFVNSENIDLYVGPRISYVKFGDFALDIDGQHTAFDVANEYV